VRILQFQLFSQISSVRASNRWEATSKGICESGSESDYDLRELTCVGMVQDLPAISDMALWERESATVAKIMKRERESRLT
jgi:hypothetical protein